MKVLWCLVIFATIEYADMQVRKDFGIECTLLSTALPSGEFERLCLLYNIAALKGQMAGDLNFNTDDGLKSAAMLFVVNCHINPLFLDCLLIKLILVCYTLNSNTYSFAILQIELWQYIYSNCSII